MQGNPMIDWQALYASRVSRIQSSDVREQAKLMGQADVISFGGGIPDPVVFPHEEAAEAAHRILKDPASARIALQYSESGGYRPLRQWLADYMGALGVPCGPDNILITSGSQQGLDLIGRLLLSPGDRALVEAPTYIGALRAFDACEASYGPITELADPAAPSAKFGYLMPDFQNPMGTCLTREERLTVLDQAAARGLPLVEDSAYEKLRYEGEPVPSLLALDTERAGGIDNSRVLYTSTFSKVIVPSLRVGWVVGAAPAIHKLMLLKQACDLHTSTFNQMLMLDLASRILESRIGVVNDLYRRRRDVVLTALAAYMPAGVTWTKPQGGMYIWVELPKGIDGADLARRALAEEKVAVVSGKSFYPNDPEPNTIRLAFPQTREDRAGEGIQRLAGLLQRMIGN
jgi:DNA-binding transcriptional MocR family regulator